MRGKDSKLTKEFILKNISNDTLSSQIAIFERYLGISNLYSIIKHGGMIVNTLRDDDLPTCTFKVYTNSNGEPKLWFRDWGEIKGKDCFDLVQHLAGCTFAEALELITIHFGLLAGELNTQKFKYVMTPNQILELTRNNTQPVEIRVKTTDWTKEHIDFWKKYELGSEDVVYDTAPIKAYWFNNHKFIVNKIAFVYWFSDKYDYKIYLPYADKAKRELKFIHNRADIVQGHNQLKFNKSTLIITSSNKDVKVLRKQARVNDFDFEVVAPMSETTPIKKEIIELYKQKYDNIILYYNNDKQGIISAEAHSKLYDCTYVTNPIGDPKDPSDIVKERGSEELRYHLETILYRNIAPF